MRTRVNKMKIFFIFLIITPLFYCTSHLLVSKYEKKKDNVRGIVYYLPRRIFIANVTLELKRCKSKDKNDDVLIEAKAEVKPFDISDVNHAYVINYENSSSDEKTINITVELYPNATLKSINTKVEDKTIDASVSALKGIFTLSKVAAGIPFLAAPSACQTNAIADIRLKAQKAANVKSKLITVKQAQQAIIAEKDRSKLPHLNKKLIEELASLANARKAYENFVNTNLKIKLSSELEKDSEGNLVKIIKPSKEDLLRWITKGQVEDLLTKLSVSFKIKPLSNRIQSAALTECSSSQTKSGADNCVFDPKFGIVYRQPGFGFLQACTPDCRTKIIIQKTVLVPQFGLLARLPLTNGIGDDDLLAAEFSANGSIVKLNYSSASAAAKSSEKFLEAAQIYAEYEKARLASKKDKIDSKLDKLEKSIEQYEKLKKLEERLKSIGN